MWKLQGRGIALKDIPNGKVTVALALVLFVINLYIILKIYFVVHKTGKRGCVKYLKGD